MIQYHLRTLGGLALARADQPPHEEALSNSKALLVLAFLATRPGHVARRAEVAELLWPESDRSRGLRALRQALFFLTKHAETLLRRTGESLALDPSTVDVDLWAFEQAAATEDYQAALDLYRGPFAAGFEHKVGSEAEHWIESVNARLAVALEVAYARQIERASAEGAVFRAVELARAFVALNPLDEPRHRLLTTTLARAGDQLGALQALEEYRQISVGVLGEALSPELEARLDAMREELLRVAPSPPATPPSRPAGPSATTEPVRRAPGTAFTVRGRPVTRVTVAWAAAVVLMASAAAAVVTRGGRPAAAPLPVLDGRFLAVVQHGNQPRVVELTVRGTGASIVERADLRETDLPAPDGRTLATTFQAPDGWNLAVRVGSEPPRVLTSAAGDEYPVDWSPDGRYLLYAHRRILADGRTQSHTLSVHDLVADTAWRLSTLESAERPGAEWSPDGTRIAFTADVRGAPDVFVVDFDGANRRNVTGHAAWDGDPAWAPGGERLAFVSRRHGSADVYLVRPDGSEIQRLSQSADDDRHPRWGSPTAIVALAGADDYRVLTVLDTYTGQRHQLPGPDNLVTLGGRLHPRSPWLERLSMTPRAQRASPGQSLTLRVAATGSDGNPLGGTIPIAWSVSDSSVIRLVAPGRVQIVGTGQATVVASAAGWRADTLALYAIPLAERAVTAVLVETWQHGLDTARWRPFGDPWPVTRPTGGPEGSGVFANNGDAFFVSGAVTVAAFSLGDGLSVEVDGRMPFTGKLHQEFGLALYAEEHADSLLASGAAPALVELRVRGPSGTDPAEAWIATAERREVLPLPDEPGRWHRYGLQVLANGDVELVVDGRLWWRAAELLARRAESVRVGLGFQSFETEIQHGRLRVFTPPRYYLPEVALDGDTTDRE